MSVLFSSCLVSWRMRSCVALGITWVAFCSLPMHSVVAQTPPVRNATTPQPSSVAPVIVPDARVMTLDDLSLYRLSYTYRGKAEHFYPTGWVGYFDEATGVACQPSAEQNGKRAWLLHPPWIGGTGFSRQRFAFKLPLARKITLRGAFAMREQNTQGSDGVTFRVAVNGIPLLEEHRKATNWRDFSFDLTRYAGRTIAVDFESDAGPNNNSSFDFAVWGGRELVLDGFTPPVTPRSQPIALPLSRLVSNGKAAYGMAPSGAYTGTTTIACAPQNAILRYEAADGSFAYTWQPPRAGDTAPLGTVKLTARLKTAPGTLAPPVSITLGSDARLTWLDGLARELRSSHLERTQSGVALVSRYEGNDKSCILRIAGRLVGKSLVFDATCDQPLLSEFSAGSWGAVLRRRAVPLPYYVAGGTVFFLDKENLFVHAFADWGASGATTIAGNTTLYRPLTDGTRRTLRDRFIFAPAWHLDEVMPTLPNPPSPYLREVGGRIVLDIWGGSYESIARKLEQLHDYGVRNVNVIIHNWQRDGYDNALPAHYPANVQWGGEAGMKGLVSTATRLGYRIALHENYVDYYPNYEKFDPADISLNPDGVQMKAWYNEGTKIQSFNVRAGAVLPLARTQSPEIHRRYGTNADYLDVHSAVFPWWHVDARASDPEAGYLGAVSDAYKELWRFERQTHNGPVFGEGATHWYWSGLLDGVEAQVPSGWNTPLLVNFDLLKLHPLQSNHGMGYYERWWDAPTWTGLAPLQVFDRYRAQTLAFGHAGFLGGATWDDVRLAWLEHNLVTPVSTRYATARPIAITYFYNGRWLDDSALLRAVADASKQGNIAEAGLFDHLQVRYDNGLTLTVNNGVQPFTTNGLTLPPYGWRAEGAGLAASTALHDGVVADFAQTLTSTFVNARPATTWSLDGGPHTSVRAADFAQTAPRTFQVTYRWTAREHYASNTHVFVHFTQLNATNEGIVFQDDHDPAIPASNWQIGQTVEDGPRTILLPATLTDGDYDIVIGLHNGRGRLPLDNDPDSHGRALLGTLQVRENGKTLAFVPHRESNADRHAAYLKDVNAANKVVDFGSARTDGSAMIRREGGAWVLQTLPRDQAFTLELSSTRFGRPTSIKCVGGSSPSVQPHAVGTAHGEWWAVPMNGAREYRWQAE